MGRYCPPCCNDCAFPAKAQSTEAPRIAETLVTARDYDCVRNGGAAIVRTESGEVGALRTDGFYPITEAGIVFHRNQEGSPIAAHL